MSQAEGWVIKAKIVRSKKFNMLNGDHFTQKVYCLLIAAKDSYGMLPADPYSLKAALGPLDDTKKPVAYAKAIKKLRGVGLIYVWDHQGDPWLYVLGHDEENQISRRAKDPVVPRPDIDAMWAETNEVMTKSGLSQDFVSHPPARAGIGSGSGKGIGKGDLDLEDDRFDQFWITYPRKVGKGAARRAWAKLHPSEELTRQILEAVEQQKKSAQWIKDGGQYIPNPATWLNQERWGDSPEVDKPPSPPPPPRVDAAIQWTDGKRVYSREDMERWQREIAADTEHKRTDPATYSRVTRCMHDRPKWDWA